MFQARAAADSTRVQRHTQVGKRGDWMAGGKCTLRKRAAVGSEEEIQVRQVGGAWRTCRQISTAACLGLGTAFQTLTDGSRPPTGNG